MTTLLSCSINKIISLLEFSISISTIVHRVVGLYTPVNEGSAKIINLLSAQGRSRLKLCTSFSSCNYDFGTDQCNEHDLIL